MRTEFVLMANFPRHTDLRHVQSLIADGVAQYERSVLVVVGDRNRIVRDLYAILGRCLGGRPSVLWCYRSVAGSSASSKKSLKKELGVDSMPIKWCYYKDSNRILGQTFGMLILQDFLPSPNVLCKTIETVQGGGLIVIMIKNTQSLKQVYSVSQGSRFTERFLMSLSFCEKCLIVDDEMHILPSRKKKRSKGEVLKDERPAVSEPADGNNTVIGLAQTVDQAHAIQKMVNFISARELYQRGDAECMVLTAPRGRGKSSALGLSLAIAITSCGYRNVVLTSPHLDNVGIVLEFTKRGLEKLKHVEHVDFFLSDTRLLMNSSTIVYVSPDAASRIADFVDLVVIDEAAAIPIPKIKQLLVRGRKCIISSTISGYEGTGRSLQLKLLNELRENFTLRSEVSLETPIRYSQGDRIEEWLNRTLCLESRPPESNIKSSALPPLCSCRLFYVDRNALFSYHRNAEILLQNIMGLFTEAHYRNTPNDLQLLSDAPQHRLFVLLESCTSKSKTVPAVLVAIQVAFEGSLTSDRIRTSISSGEQSPGDLIPWALAQQFTLSSFPSLTGARIVRIATHPDLQRLKYGTYALNQLVKFFKNNVRPEKASWSKDDSLQNEQVAGENADKCHLQFDVKLRKCPLPPLLVPIEKMMAPQIEWIGASFGLSHVLLNFWLRNGFSVAYLRQVPNDVTGNRNIILLREISSGGWLEGIVLDMRRRLIRLLSRLDDLEITTCLDMLKSTDINATKTEEVLEISQHLSEQDIARLKQFARGLSDHRSVADIMPVLADWIFNRRLKVDMSDLHLAILLGLALQCREVESVASEINLTGSQVLAILAKVLRKILGALRV